MKKVTLAEAAEYFGISKEAIHNRIRRGSLEVVMEHGEKKVLLDTQKAQGTRTRVRTQTAPKSSSNDERYYKLLQEQNTKLQERVAELEGETRSLRDQKELMLIEERQKIEQIYKEKDEQLKQFFTSIASQFALTHTPKEVVAPVLTQESETIEVAIQEKKQPIKVEDLLSVKKFIKNFAKKQKCSLEKIDRIKKRFKKYAKKDKRIIIVDGKHYVDTKKYDYSNLTKW